MHDLRFSWQSVLLSVYDLSDYFCVFLVLENADFVLTAVSYSLSSHGQGENFCKDDLAKRASVLNHLLQSCTRICVYKFDFSDQ